MYVLSTSWHFLMYFLSVKFPWLRGLRFSWFPCLCQCSAQDTLLQGRCRHLHEVCPAFQSHMRLRAPLTHSKFTALRLFFRIRLHCASVYSPSFCHQGLILCISIPDIWEFSALFKRNAQKMSVALKKMCFFFMVQFRYINPQTFLPCRTAPFQCLSVVSASEGLTMPAA